MKCKDVGITTRRGKILWDALSDLAILKQFLIIREGQVKDIHG